MSNICIYHKNCYDGICSAWIVWKVFNKDVELVPMNYGDKLDWLTKGHYNSTDKVIVVDFSFPREIMLALKSMFPNLLVIDHHKTAQKELEGLSFCIFDMNESGASLAWYNFFPYKILPILVKYVKDRDLWLHKERNTQEINSFIQSFPMTVESYDSLYESLRDPVEFEDAIVGGASILRYKEKLVEDICKTAGVVDDIPTVNTSVLFSEVGHRLCELYPTSFYSKSYYDRVVDGVRQYSLRSIGDYDVSKVAKELGGGGHKNAAGFTRKT